MKTLLIVVVFTVLVFCVSRSNNVSAFSRQPLRSVRTGCRSDNGSGRSVILCDAPSSVDNTENFGHVGSDTTNDVVFTLLLCRHGDSIFNGGEPGRPETFTGWMDVPLSNKGVKEAKASASQVSAYDLGIDACFTSVLQRAQLTAHYCLWAFADKPQVFGPRSFVMDWRLSERHYGALQGLVKAEAEAGLHGHDPSQVKKWRRGWYAVPPLLDDDDPRRHEELRKFSSLCGSPSNVPRGESLEQVAENRIRPFLTDRLLPTLTRAASVELQATGTPTDPVIDDILTSQEVVVQRRNATGLVVAHANSLRALIGVICEVEKHNDQTIVSCIEKLRLPTGQPLVLKFKERSDGSFQVCDLNGIPYDFFPDRDQHKGDGGDTPDRKPNQQYRTPQKRKQIAQYLPVWPLAALPLPSSNSFTSTKMTSSIYNKKGSVGYKPNVKDAVNTASDPLLVHTLT
mmetsp:Transcript_42537/g.102510  ORF Transcript_42537/g.102510 Transcript_42537/m.102510 type:complete len:456 (-) Transcript_42537:3937-5304(-)